MRWLLSILIWICSTSAWAHAAGSSELTLCSTAEKTTIQWQLDPEDLQYLRQPPSLQIDTQTPRHATKTGDSTFQWSLPENVDHRPIRLLSMDDLRFGHRVLVRRCGHVNAIGVMSAQRSELPITLQPRTSPMSQSVWSGSLHIIQGFDHLLFLGVLMLGCAGFREMLASVTLFALAHSLTLATTASGTILVSPDWVEPAIAASIVATALVNLKPTSQTLRLILTMAFGLIHGLGFGGYFVDNLKDDLSHWPTIIGFNLGVELGQVAILILAYGVIRYVVTTGHVRLAQIRLTGSLTGALIGGVWFLTRIAG